AGSIRCAKRQSCRLVSRKAGEGSSRAETKPHPQACGSLLRLGCAGCAVDGAPMQWTSGGEKARRVARKDASQLAASPGMDCQPTPEPLREVAGQDARRPLHRGGLSLGYFSLATQREVTRSPKASESSAPNPRMRREAMSNRAKSTVTGSRPGRSPACPEPVEEQGRRCRSSDRAGEHRAWRRSYSGIGVTRSPATGPGRVKLDAKGPIAPVEQRPPGEPEHDQRQAIQ
ncbi:hypothetical protein SAMN05216289_1091, partial [Dokdonella immobilis]